MNIIKPYLENRNLQKIRLGIEIMLINISKFIIIFSIAIFLDVFWESAIVLTAFGILRRTIVGIHAKSSRRCTVFSAMLIVGGGIFPSLIILNNNIIVVLFIINMILTYKYAPGDTEKNPINDVNKRNRLRKESMKRVGLVALISFIILNEVVKTLITFGYTAAVISILPILFEFCNQKRAH